MAKDKGRFDTIQADFLEQQNRASLDQRARRRLLKKLEGIDGGNRRLAVYFARPDKALSPYDLLPFSSMLKSIGQVQNLDLVVVSNGGDGITAEKILDLCRKYCTDKLRVVVPLHAKSAATLLALGADEIVMGETSELGPIDAQVLVMQDNAPQQVSADHFLRARDRCLDELNSGDQAKIEAAQIQLTLLGPAFLQHCEDLMNFGRDCARKQLKSHMFRNDYASDPVGWDSRIEEILKNLTQTSKYLLHGRMITVADMQADPVLKSLKTLALGSDNEYWMILHELLLRTDIVAQANNIGKIVFASSYQLMSSGS